MTVAAQQAHRFLDLPEAQQRAIRMMQAVNFGRVYFRVLCGEPDMAGPWRTWQTVKFTGGQNGPRPEVDLADFELCQEQVALLEAIGRVRDAARVTIEVRRGVPFLVEIEQDHQAA